MGESNTYLQYVSGVIKGKDIRKLSEQIRSMRKSNKYYEAIKLMLQHSPN